MTGRISLTMDNVEIDEKELVKLAKKDPKAFGDLYDRYYPRIFGYILKRTANFEVAKDVTSETFFKALKSLWQFQWQSAPFSSWLYKIATNEIINHFRETKRRISVSLEQVPELESGSDPKKEVLEAELKFEKNQTFLFLKKKVLTLSLDYQEVIVLRFFEKKKIKEISQILKKKEGTVKSLLSRGLEKLRVLADDATIWK